MPEKNYRYSIRTRITFLFILFAFVVVNTMGFYFYTKMRSSFENELGKTLLGIVQTSAKNIEPELLAYIKPGTESSKFYYTIQEPIQVIRDVFKVKRVYLIDSTFTTLIDSDTAGIIGSRLPHLLSNSYELENALSGQASVSPLYRGANGDLYKSAFAPVTNADNKIVAIAGVDASPEFLVIINDIRTSLLFINVFSLIIAATLGIFLTNVFFNPVQKLVQVSKKIIAGEKPDPISGLPDNEIGYLGQVFNTMQDSIRTKEDSLKELHRIAENKADEIQTYNDYILQSINNGVITVDLAGAITVFNREAKTLLAMDRQPQSGQNILSVFPAEHPLRPILEGKSESLDKTYHNITLSIADQTVNLAIQESELLDRAKNVIGHNYVITDLTEVYMLQERIKEQERMAYLGQLSATVAHEVRNPLNSMELFMGLLKRDTEFSGEQKEIINSVQKEIRSLNGIVTDFLQFAKPSKLVLSQFLVGNLVDEALFLSSNAIEEKQIIIQNKIKNSEKTLNGDFNQLKQVLLNLFLNAILAMDDKGTLTIQFADSTKEAGTLTLEIIDNGSGMSPETVGQIFKPFFSTRSSGVGLGLSIVKNIVQMHDGVITVASKPGKGTAFKVTLPIERD